MRLPNFAAVRMFWLVSSDELEKMSPTLNISKSKPKSYLKGPI